VNVERLTRTLLRSGRRGIPAAGHRILVHPDHMRAGSRGLRSMRRIGRFDPVATPATVAGSTAHFHVYYANVLGQSGDKIAQAVLKNCERDYQTISGMFGQQKSIQFNIVIAPLSQNMDGTGGAYHHSCQATDLYCDVQLTPTINPDVTNALVVAEEVEVFQAVQGGGWNCGGSNGEGLSRVLAEELYPKVLENLGYFSARLWLNSRRPNFVRRTLPSDRNMVANGCSVLFLNYMHVQLGIGWDKICQAPSPTLAGTYNKATGKSAPFRDFAALLAKEFPRGQPSNLATDNPFPIAAAASTAQEREPSATKRSAEKGAASAPASASAAPGGEASGKDVPKSK
jgi:hypothetical protein